MKPLALSSLRARMTWGFAAWFSFVALCACAVFLLWSRQLARRDASERVQAAAQLVAREWHGERGTEKIAKALREAQEDMRLDNVVVVIVDETGAVLGANRTAAPLPDVMRKRGFVMATVRTKNASVVAGMDWQPTEAILERQAVLLLLMVLTVAGCGAVAAWFLVGRTLRPIALLAGEATLASVDPLRARLRVPSGDAEIVHLVGTLNGFLTRFAESNREREQFYAAAAHELRTPLSVLSGNIELALSRPRTSSDYAETLTELQNETTRLINLAEGLLTMNRLQTASDAGESETVNVADECARVVASLALLAERRRVVIETHGEAQTFAPVAHVQMLLRNLVENAAKYADPGGTVRVSIGGDATGASVAVRNDYRGADALPLYRLDEPFFRADPSRSVETGGNGLGLAICRRLANAHGWKLSLTAEENGVLARCVFPTLQA